MNPSRGYTLLELLVALALFSVAILLVSGAYLMILNINYNAQALSSGVDDLSFALETMSRDIRTGIHYDCGAVNPSTSCSFQREDGTSVTYRYVGGEIQETINGVSSMLLSDQNVHITNFSFYSSGVQPASAGDYLQPHVTILVSGTVTYGKSSQSFYLESGATMRGNDI